ncbi:MAG: hypothetical protein ABI534_03260 [Chloroflexota bacterium]
MIATATLRRLTGIVMLALATVGCGGAPGIGSSAPSGDVPPPSGAVPIGSGEPMVHVSDPVAHLGYDIPAGWETDTDDLVEFFTAISAPDVNADGPSMQLVASGPYDAGLGEPVTRENVADITRRDAAGFADFFFTAPADRVTLIDSAIEVSGEPGHRVRLRITFDDTSKPPAIVEARAVVGSQPAFLLALSVDDEGPMVAQLDSVLASLAVEP